MRTVAILTAAGSGTRLGSDRPKALVELAGIPLVVRAATALVDAGVLDRLVVTAPQEAADEMRQLMAAAALPVPVRVVVGGPTRQASVAAGLAAVQDGGSDGLPPLVGADVVLVHDAARPLVGRATVRRVARAAATLGAVVPGVPVVDTVKQVDEGSRVTGTPDRRGLRAVQTPQGFTLSVLRRAHDAAAGLAGDDGTAASDDAALVEALGLPVHVVEGDPAAVKITTAHDLLLAGLLLSGAP